MYDIEQISWTLNELAGDYEIGNLQELRKKLKGLSRRPGTDIFNKKTISPDNDWAFHFGGRTELQYNIGIEKEGLRVGVAFSLEPSFSLPDVSILFPKILKFNRYLKKNVEKFNNYKMWHWGTSGRSSISNVYEINNDLMVVHNFIFIGKICKSVNYDEILKIFDDFLNLYTYVES